jgi:hypothetical protein
MQIIHMYTSYTSFVGCDKKEKKKKKNKKGPVWYVFSFSVLVS